jgi:hypothetical protein
MFHCSGVFLQLPNCALVHCALHCSRLVLTRPDLLLLCMNLSESPLPKSTFATRDILFDAHHALCKGFVTIVQPPLEFSLSFICCASPFLQTLHQLPLLLVSFSYVCRLFGISVILICHLVHLITPFELPSSHCFSAHRQMLEFSEPILSCLC